MLLSKDPKSGIVLYHCVFSLFSQLVVSVSKFSLYFISFYNRSLNFIFNFADLSSKARSFYHSKIPEFVSDPSERHASRDRSKRSTHALLEKIVLKYIRKESSDDSGDFESELQLPSLLHRIRTLNVLIPHAIHSFTVLTPSTATRTFRQCSRSARRSWSQLELDFASLGCFSCDRN